MNRNSHFFCDKNYDIISKVFITLFSVFMLTLAVTTPTQTAGESDDYMIATITLENRFSLRILPSDIEQAKVDFPEHYSYIKESYDIVCVSNPMTSGSYFVSDEGEIYSWYFGTYSLACLPMKWLLKILGQNQSYAFAITNVLAFSVALITVFLSLKVKRANVLLTVFLLALSPAVFYYFWPSSEMFTFSLVIISLVFFTNQKHKLAGFFVSVASTLNPTIMVYGAVVLLDYLVKLYQTERTVGQVNLFQVIVTNIKDIVITGFCFVPSLFPFVYNYLKFGLFHLQQVLNFNDNEYFWGRFFSYLFDLNLGFLPYFLISFPLFILIVCYGIYKKNRLSILYFIAFFGTVFVFSFMSHINCGMTGLSRYGMWTFPIFIFYLTTCADQLIAQVAVKRLFHGALVFSACLTALISSCFYMANPGLNDSKFSPMATFVLNRFPALYNPLPSTFSWKITTQGGGYHYTNPVLYRTKEGVVTKILVNAETLEQMRKLIDTDEQSLKIIENQTMKIIQSKGLQYINISPKYNVKMSPKGYSELNPAIADNNLSITELRFVNSEISSKQATIKPSGLQYGPYILLPQGTYTITITGQNLDKASFYATSDVGQKVISIEFIEQSPNKIVYQFVLSEPETSAIEFLLKNDSTEDIALYNITL